MTPLYLIMIFGLFAPAEVGAQKITSPPPPITAPGPLSIDDKVFDFGGVGTSSSVTQQIEIVNSGDKPLTITKVYCAYHNTLDPESYVSFSWTKKPIKPGKRGSISITYKAMSDIGSFKDEIAVETGDSGQARFYLTGAIVPVKDHPAPDYDPLTPLGAVLGAVLINNMGK
jgi:hypothetical protein